MYDELVKRLRSEAECPDNYQEDSCLMREAADAIERLAKDLERSKEYETFWEKEANEALKKFQTTVASKPCWIPVTERSPGSGVPTLICGDGNVVEQGFFDDEYGYWYDWGGNRTFVHHWMPLPEPPKEGKNND